MTDLSPRIGTPFGLSVDQHKSLVYTCISTVAMGCKMTMMDTGWLTVKQLLFSTGIMSFSKNYFGSSNGNSLQSSSFGCVKIK